MAVEYKRIVLRKGAEADLPDDLLPGELAFTTDTHRLFIGASTGNKEIAIGDFIRSINGELPDSSGNFTVDEVTGVSISEGVLSIERNNDQQAYTVDLKEVLSIEDLDNVTLTDLQANEILKYNGTSWVNTNDVDTRTIVDSLTVDSNHQITLGQTNDVADITLDLSGIGNKTVKNFRLNQTSSFICLDAQNDVTPEGDQAACEAAGHTWTEQITINPDQVDLILNDDTVLSVDISQVTIDNTVTNFALVDNDQIQLTVEGRETPYTVDISGIRNNTIQSFTLNNTNDPGELTLTTLGGTSYGIDTFAVYDQRYIQTDHSHGKINGDGQIEPGTPGIDVDIETGDKLLIVNSGASSTITTADILFDTAETGKYLSQAGEFTTPTFDTSGLAASDHSHGIITNDGKIAGNGVGIGLNDRLVIAKSSEDNLLRTTSIVFDASQPTKFLSQDGTFKIPSFNPGTYTETELTELTTGQTYEVSNFTGYDKLVAILYSDPNASFNTTAGVSDTVDVRQALQLHFETYSDPNTGTCFINGEPTLAQNQQECDTAGGTWVPTTFNSFGKVDFQPGGTLARVSSTNVQFTQPSAVNGHTWKLKIIGVTF